MQTSFRVVVVGCRRGYCVYVYVYCDSAMSTCSSLRPLLACLYCINFKYTELLNINPRGLIVKKYSFALILKSCGLIVKSRGLL